MANNLLTELLLLVKAQVDTTGFNKVNNNIKKTHQNIFSLKKLFGAFIGFDIYQGIKKLAFSTVQMSKDIGAMESRFYAITKSNKAANEEMEWAIKLAKDDAVSIKSVADSYSIFYAATQKSIGTGGAREVFKDWTDVSRVLHLNEYQFERITYALREMASKGAIYSQDLRMQIGTHVPNAMGLARQAAEQLGYSGNDWFEKFQSAAKGNQKLINQFIVLFSRGAKTMYADSEALAEAMKKPDAQLQKLSNTWWDFQRRIVGGGFEKDLVKTLQVLNFILEKLTKHAGGIYKWTKRILGLVLILVGANALGLLIKYGTIALSILGSFILQCQRMGFVIAFIISIGTKFKWLATLIKGSGLWFLISTPQGWAILAIAAIGGLFYFLFKNLDKISAWFVKLGWQFDTFINNVITKFNNSPLGQWWKKTHGGEAVDIAVKDKLTRKSTWLTPVPVQAVQYALPKIKNMVHPNNNSTPLRTSNNAPSTKISSLNINNTINTTGNDPAEIQKALDDNNKNLISSLQGYLLNGVANSNINSKPNGEFA